MRKVVLGFPRSGTGTMAHIHNLGHEFWNENGTSDWRLVPSYKKEKEDYIIHVVRNPLDVIASNLFTIRTDSLNLISKGLDKGYISIIRTIVLGLIEWTKIIEKLKPDEIIKVETLSIIRNYRGEHPKLSWKDLSYLPEEDIIELKKHAKKYGYKTE